MKKQLLLLAVLAMFTNAMSQDTIQTRALRDNYYYNVWPYDTLDSKSGYPRLVDFLWEHVPYWAKRFYTADTLTIVGIAAALEPIERTNYTVINITDSNSYEYFSLYGESADSLRPLSDSLVFHVNHTPVAYYMDFDYQYSPSQPAGGRTSFPLLAVSEEYFDHPYQVVPGRFYVGMTSRSAIDTIDALTGRWIGFKTSPLELSGIMTACYPYGVPPTDTIVFRMHWDSIWDYTLGWTVCDTTVTMCQTTNYVTFLFPIIAPPGPCDTLTTGYLVVHPGNRLIVAPGDTLVIGGDTLVNTADTLVVTLGDTVVIGGRTLVLDVGDTLFVNPGDTLFVGPDGSIHVNPGGTIVVNPGSGTPGDDPGDDPGAGLRQTDMVSRYTSVSPNPATERATVLSSFGLERIEVYDSQGRQTLTLPATGYRAVLDTHAWPSGTYLLRITTPLGPTTKKLLVQ